MSWSSDIERFRLKVHRRKKAIFLRWVDLIFDSVVDGSSVTGAPGQPVQIANLKRSWQKVLEAEFEALVITNSPYAPGIEDQVGSLGQTITLRSAVGGFHSVKLTRAGATKLLRQAARDVLAGVVA